MFKQWLLVCLAGATFLLVWGIVLIEVYKMNQPALPMREVAKVERSELLKGNDNLDSLEPIIEVVTETSNQNEKLVVKDLRQIDFSDVSGPEGISIDDVLNRLELN